jgi:hypothetical protein
MRAFAASAVLVLGLMPSLCSSREKPKPPESSTVEVHAPAADCSVDIDSGPPSRPGDSGVVVFSSVEPGDHYVHIVCPGGRNTSLLISPSPGEKLQVTGEEDPAAEFAGLEIAEVQLRLREYIRNAVRLRALGKIDEAAAHLRGARKLDPANSDLHRELGITFLVGKDWKRARIEMLEAIRSDPADAEAYNGLGYALEKLGMIDAAVEAFHTATKLDPSDSTYRRQYFDALGRQVEARAAPKKK